MTCSLTKNCLSHIQTILQHAFCMESRRLIISWMNRQKWNRWINIKVKPCKNHNILITTNNFYGWLHCKVLKDAHLSEKPRSAKYKCSFAIVCKVFDDSNPADFIQKYYLMGILFYCILNRKSFHKNFHVIV